MSSHAYSTSITMNSSSPETTSCHGHTRVALFVGILLVSISGHSPAAPIDESYQYDPLNRLIAAGGSTYQHDAAGNLVQTTAAVTPSLFVSPGTASLDSAANSNTTVSLTANVAWTASSDQTWLGVSPESGSVGGSLTFTANSSNPSTSPRNATVTISGGGLTAEVLVTQVGSPPVGALSLSPTSVTVAWQAASVYGFAVNAAGAWEAASDQPWLTLTTLQGSGDGSVLFSVSENTTSALRTALVTVTSGPESAVFTLHQQSGVVTDDHGNTISTATPLPGGGSGVSGSLTPGDQDFFRIPAQGEGILIVWTEGATNTYGVLYSSTAGIRDEDDNSDRGANFRLSARIADDDSYVQIFGADGTASGSYVLRWRFIPATQPMQITYLEKDGELLNLAYTTPEPAATYYIQASHNLVDWSDIASGPGTVGEIYYIFSDQTADSKRFFRVSLLPSIPAGFAFIPGGAFLMGDATGAGSADESPVHSVTVAGFFMARNETTKREWDVVRAWATAPGRGYSDLAAGNGSLPSKGENHPVHSISWYDMVKWCNARSEMEGLLPCYTIDGVVYRAGQIDNVFCNFGANGYRLPTEAEWEKAARGGLNANNFPWVGTITHAQANYWVYSVDGIANFYSYDTSPSKGFHPTYASSEPPGSSPVGSFPANAYGLYDMAGNVLEWCWDGPRVYGAAAPSNPLGSTLDNTRVYRGGSWGHSASSARVSFRGNGAVSSEAHPTLGFRLARKAVP